MATVPDLACTVSLILMQDGETVAQESKTFDRIGTTQVSAIGASSIRQGKNDTSDSSASSNRISGASVTAVFESSRDVLPQQYSGGATHYNEIDTAADRDARAILERNVKLQEDASAATAGEGQGVYRGLGAYKSFTQKDSVAQISANKVTG